MEGWLTLRRGLVEERGVSNYTGTDSVGEAGVFPSPCGPVDSLDESQILTKEFYLPRKIHASHYSPID